MKAVAKEITIYVPVILGGVWTVASSPAARRGLSELWRRHVVEAACSGSGGFTGLSWSTSRSAWALARVVDQDYHAVTLRSIRPAIDAPRTR
ncbi:hypothetical protein FRAHR75_280010 [Frankia sp. Hr75.2]|nr:hypothetical protein FRAHR75_280010 [Frankia sp. Hr75.2]